jgi:hypothetical protein
VGACAKYVSDLQADRAVEHSLESYSLPRLGRAFGDQPDSLGRGMKAILEWWWKKRMARTIKLRLSLYRND